MNETSILLPQPPSLIENDNIYFYTIIDCAQMDEDFYQKVSRTPNLISQSLFTNTPHAQSALAGPLLVKLETDKDEAFVRSIQTIENKKPAVVWLWSEKDFNPVCSTLRHLLFAETEQGKKFFLRYFDPRCLETLLATFKEDPKTSEAISHIKVWAFKKEEQYQYLT